MQGKVGVPVCLEQRVNASERLCLNLPIMDAVESCGEKCANLCRVYKLIMISRVPGYGHLEYLVFELLVDLINLLNKFCWDIIIIFIIIT